MNEIIEIANDENGSEYIDARELHEKLGNKRKFSDWIKQRIEQYGFREGDDFTNHKIVIGKSTRIEYRLTKDMAKELAIVENNEAGRKIRNYFIAAEKKLREIAARPLTTQEQIALIAKGNGELAGQVKELGDRVTELDGNQVLSSARYDYVSKFVNRKVREYAEVHGLDYKEHVGALRQDLSRQILDITGVRVRRDLRDKHFDSVVDLIENWTPSTATVFKIKQTTLEM
ncbi:antA/AntB antirepressor family protein [Weissella ceti]|uniref:AntA/AntB antirepressor family protein n=1 Tax=Weissella ceti TaxID=759620 RepID=A0ABT3E489_9LACO|nr:antA/AntB antirepressor family protein [Weissella ceti]MCW0953228.1 antA/AntB antirepressor family protein [Weissella ceti]QVK12744.1 antA/AntB antirepressor family protein [Weissella ceti]